MQVIYTSILSELLYLSDASSLSNTIDPLHKLSLIDEVENDLVKEVFMLHRLVQKTTRGYMAKHRENEEIQEN